MSQKPQLYIKKKHQDTSHEDKDLNIMGLNIHILYFNLTGLISRRGDG